jgi:hypothetical protein
MSNLNSNPPVHFSASGEVLSLNAMDFEAMSNMMAWHLSKSKSPVALMRMILFFGGSIPTEDEQNLEYRKSIPKDWLYREDFLVNKAKIKEFIDFGYLTLADFHKVLTSNLDLHEALNNNHRVLVSPPPKR